MFGLNNVKLKISLTEPFIIHSKPALWQECDGKCKKEEEGLSSP